MSVNKVILLGNVGKDPEVRYLDTGIAVATFPLATTDRAYTLANGTQVPERTECIILFYGVDWRRRQRSMFIRAINFTLKEKSEAVLTTIKREQNDISLKYLWIIWRC